MNMLKKTAICAGSFDPPTNGHINIIERGLKIFDKIVIALGKKEAKVGLFSLEERVDLLKEIFCDNPRIEIDTFDGLLINYAKQKGVSTLLRGLRTIGDFEYEQQMALANKSLEPKIETIFLMTEGQLSHISSSIIKEIVYHGGSVRDMIPPIVEKKLKLKLKHPHPNPLPC